ncbi:hypothetical protein DFH07DRAFT_963346 [Mycena maculata]|uniref:Uncharacterized protein n=1 Tax=Mycena maculata TaxID=230809 RepID=A0AAD7N4P3_9AGAR|nr:hypothetical protein DFH07DRAFT_963346 [Mycena maculata]
MSTPASPADITWAGQTATYFEFGLVAQTFFLVTGLPITTTRVEDCHQHWGYVNNHSFVYGLLAAYWCYSIADVVIKLALNPYYVPDPTDAILKWSPLFNAISLINYVVSDAIVVWRAWIICLRNHRKYMYIPVVFWFFTAISVLGII